VHEREKDHVATCPNVHDALCKYERERERERKTERKRETQKKKERERGKQQESETASLLAL